MKIIKKQANKHKLKVAFDWRNPTLILWNSTQSQSSPWSIHLKKLFESASDTVFRNLSFMDLRMKNKFEVFSVISFTTFPKWQMNHI